MHYWTRYFYKNHCSHQFNVFRLASHSKETLEELVRNGMSVARLNLSHCSHEFAAQVVRDVKACSESVGIWFDINGPKVRYESLLKIPFMMNVDHEHLVSNESRS